MPKIKQSTAGACKTPLGDKQAFAAAGPNGPPMTRFVCAVCDTKYFDMGAYFYDKPSVKCMWCVKFAKKKQPQTVDSN
jgi:hypothetical protein